MISYEVLCKYELVIEDTHTINIFCISPHILLHRVGLYLLCAAAAAPFFTIYCKFVLRPYLRSTTNQQQQHFFFPLTYYIIITAKPTFDLDIRTSNLRLLCRA